MEIQQYKWKFSEEASQEKEDTSFDENSNIDSENKKRFINRNNEWIRNYKNM